MIPRAAFVVLMVLVASAAVPLGANRMWAWALMAIVVGVLMIAMALAMAANPAAAPMPWRNYRVPAIGYLLVLVWTLVQASTATPAALHHPLWADAEAILGTPLVGAISLDPPETLSEATRFIAYGGIFWLAMQFACRDGRARTMLWVIVLAITANAAYGLLVQISGTNTILWFDKWAYPNVVTGTFVNRNHFATYLGLGLIVTLTFLIEEMRRIAAGVSLRTFGGLVEVSESLTLRFYLLSGLVGLLVLAALMTGSRGGLAAIAAGVAALLGGIALSTLVSGGRVARLGLALAAGAGLALLLSGEIVVERAYHGDGATERAGLYAATARAVAERPLLGTGPGTYGEAFLAYRPHDIGVSRLRLWYDHAHNTYLEVAFESGIPALIVLLLMAGWVLVVLARGARTRRHNDLLPAVGIGATALVAVHALFDFSIEIPAVAATYLAILGIAYAQAFNHAERTEGPANRNGPDSRAGPDGTPRPPEAA